MKIILYIILFYFLFAFIARYVFPYFFRYFVKRLNRRFYENMDNINNNKYYNEKEGEIRINKSNEKNTNKNNDIGEYVDYEEIK